MTLAFLAIGTVSIVGITLRFAIRSAHKEHHLSR